jgi:hypothetical protein
MVVNGYNLKFVWNMQLTKLMYGLMILIQTVLREKSVINRGRLEQKSLRGNSFKKASENLQKQRSKSCINLKMPHITGQASIFKKKLLKLVNVSRNGTSLYLTKILF